MSALAGRGLMVPAGYLAHRGTSSTPPTWP